MAPRQPTRFKARTLKPAPSPQSASTSKGSKAQATRLYNARSSATSDPMKPHALKLRTSSDAGVRKRAARSRRRKERASKLDLGELVGALDEAEGDGIEDAEQQDVQKNKSTRTNKHVSNVVQAMQRQKSLGSKKGTSKRRVQIAKLERERWKRNWDVLTAGGEVRRYGSSDGTVQGVTDEERRARQWAALRGHIASSMEKKDIPTDG